MRWRVHGDTETVLKPRPRGPSLKPRAECSVEGCDRFAASRGWCNKHYLRYRRTGSPDVVRRVVSQAGPLATFWANVDKRGPNECWPWKRPPMAQGYGQLQWLDGTVWYAHRIAYFLAYGEIPAGDPRDPIELDHVCHDHRVCPETNRCPHRLCCNPAHLIAKPRSANTGRTAFWEVCPPGCTCGRHYGSVKPAGAPGRKCPPGCSCGRHANRGLPGSGKCLPGCACGRHRMRAA
jgi:hypothetical protein